MDQRYTIQNDNHELNHAHHSPADQEIHTNSQTMKNKPWYKKGWIVLAGFITLLLALYLFASSMSSSMQGIENSIDQQTEVMQQQNQILSVQNEVLRGIESGVMQMKASLDELVAKIDSWFSELKS
jgi:predicted PurR-regulated permease PerM